MGSIGSIPEMTKPRTGFVKAVKKLLINKVLMFNIFSGIFYILGSGGYITYIAKYVEVQFHRSSADATIVTGTFSGEIHLPDFKWISKFKFHFNRSRNSAWNGLWPTGFRLLHLKSEAMCQISALLECHSGWHLRFWTVRQPVLYLSRR